MNIKEVESKEPLNPEIGLRVVKSISYDKITDTLTVTYATWALEDCELSR